MRKFAKVELGGKEYLLRYEFNEICELEEMFGKGIGAIFSQEQVGFRSLRALYWAGLKWKVKGITIQRVGQMLQEELENGREFDDLFTPIETAFAASGLFKDEEEEASGEELGN